MQFSINGLRSHTYFTFYPFFLQGKNTLEYRIISLVGTAEVLKSHEIYKKLMLHFVFSHICCNGLSSTSPFSFMNNVFVCVCVAQKRSADVAMCNCNSL